MGKIVVGWNRRRLGAGPLCVAKVRPRLPQRTRAAADVFHSNLWAPAVCSRGWGGAGLMCIAGQQGS